MVDALNKSANLVENGLEDGENNSLEGTSDEEEEEENLSQNVPKMDADSIKALLKELKEDISAQNQKNSDALVEQVSSKMSEQAEQFNDALNEVQGNVEQVRREMIGQRADGGNEDELQNQAAIAQNQSSRNEDDLNASPQDQRKSTRDSKKNETEVKETRKSSRSRDDKQSHDARRKEYGGANYAQPEMNFWNQNHGQPPNVRQPPPNIQHVQQQSAPPQPNVQYKQQRNRQAQWDFQTSPPLNLSQPPDKQQQAQGTQLWPGGQGAHYQDRSQLFQPSTNLGQNNGVQQKSR
ncbi:MAG: hypothetical protein GY822_00080, partial [Deltaproteobacteria bacterium]|nr:hypothetical protein [Deltaproteobacteria bacterium]